MRKVLSVVVLLAVLGALGFVLYSKGAGAPGSGANSAEAKAQALNLLKALEASADSGAGQAYAAHKDYILRLVDAHHEAAYAKGFTGGNLFSKGEFDEAQYRAALWDLVIEQAEREGKPEVKDPLRAIGAKGGTGASPFGSANF
ncbi:MAG TPA: hypothetical protein DEB06_01840 [Phycisphaerales bacterium]|nr:hypothetical protein [Phycisphaerales bacterium]